MHTHRCYLVDGFPGYPPVKDCGWLFGTIGAAVAHTPDFSQPGAWVWFITGKFCVVRTLSQIERIT
jgi:hypothetical protein